MVWCAIELAMDYSRLEKVFSTIHLVYHRNKNQHGSTMWWKWLSILRRSLLKLIDALQTKREKRYMSISKYLRVYVIPKSYVAFSTVIADTQFSTLGTVLLAALAQTNNAIVPLQRRRQETKIKKVTMSSSTIVKGHDNTKDDFGTPIQRHYAESSIDHHQSHMQGTNEDQDAAHSEIIEKPEQVQRTTEKIKKTKAKKKKSANAIDDIFNALK